MRLIDADALKTEVENMVLRREGFHENDYEYGRNQTLDYVADILIDDAPTIDAVPVVKGHWIYDRTKGIKTCKCSECLTSYGCMDTPYCPNCGAKMVREDGEEE